MSTKEFVSVLNREAVQAIVRLVTLVGMPVLTYLGTLAITKFDTLATNQEIMIHRLDSLTYKVRITEGTIYNLQKNDQLFKVKQDAVIFSCKINTGIGSEFTADYNTKYSELFSENQFLNP